MTKIILSLTVAMVATAASNGSAKLNRLPAAARDAARAETANSEVLSVKKEKEDGKTVYEIETRRAGHTRDLIIDGNGKVLVVEEEVALTDLPQAAQAGIQREAGGAKILRVETITRGSAKTFEAVIETKGKKREINVSADGALIK